jgi:surface antigen
MINQLRRENPSCRAAAASSSSSFIHSRGDNLSMDDGGVREEPQGAERSRRNSGLPPGEHEMKKLIVSLVMVASLAGCQEVRNQQVGAAVGGALGGLLGAQVGSGSGQIAAAVAGGLLGAYLGGNVGRTMDEVDRRQARDSLERNPTGQTSTWQNPDSGNSYAVTPTRTYEDQGQPCRDYTTEAWIEGQRETVTGTACRQPDGSWRAV